MGSYYSNEADVVQFLFATVLNLLFSALLFLINDCQLYASSIGIKNGDEGKGGDCLRMIFFFTSAIPKRSDSQNTPAF